MEWLRRAVAEPMGIREAATALGIYVVVCALAAVTLMDYPEMSAASRAEGIHGTFRVEQLSCDKLGCTSVGSFTADGVPAVHGGLERELPLGTEVAAQYFPASGMIYPVDYALSRDVMSGGVAGVVALGMTLAGGALLFVFIKDRLAKRRSSGIPNEAAPPRRAGSERDN